jgi:hypothetical protein
VCQDNSPLTGGACEHELRQIIEQFVANTFGPRRQLVALHARPSAYRTSFAIDELEIELDGGQIVRLLRKDLGRAALHESARAAKPEFLYDPMREIEVYRNVFADARLGTPRCYASVVDAAQGRYWLFLEQVPAVELYQVGDLAAWQDAARWLAALHGRFAGSTDQVRRAAPLLVYDAAFYRMWLNRAAAFVEQASSRYNASELSGWRRLVSNYDRVVEPLVEIAPTLIHGEFYASNVLVGSADGRVRVCPVDWEMAAVGPGLIDLAALTSGRWTCDERTAIARAYFHGLRGEGVGSDSFESLWGALGHCRVHLAVQWLGWSSDWRPPAEHAQNWLAEALTAYLQIESA